MNQIKPISAAPKDRDILIAWGSVWGVQGFTVGHLEKKQYIGENHTREVWVHENGLDILDGGYYIFGWYELPPIPKEICVG